MMNSDMGTQHFKTISDNPQDDEAFLEEWTDSTQLQAAGYGGLL